MPDQTPDKPKMDFSKLEEYSKESEWRMRNDDGVEYGPYTWEQLLQFAKEGRVSLTGELRNSSATKGKWIRVARLTAIASLITLNTPPAPAVLSPPAFTQPTPIPPTPKTTPPTPTDDSLFEALSQSSSRKSLSAFSNKSTSIFDVFDWSFKSYVTPWAIRFLWIVFVVIWWLCLVLGIVLNVYVIAAGSWLVLSGETPERAGYVSFYGLISLCIYITVQFILLLVIRIAYESIIVLFDISNSLKRIAAKQ